MSTSTDCDSVSLAVGLCTIASIIMVSAILGIMIGRKTAERTEAPTAELKSLTHVSAPLQPGSAGLAVGADIITKLKSKNNKVLEARLGMLEGMTRMEKEKIEKEKDEMAAATELWKLKVAKYKRQSAASEARLNQLAAEVVKCGDDLAENCVAEVDNGEAAKTPNGGL